MAALSADNQNQVKPRLTYEAVVIGAGQAGLAMRSYYLTQQKGSHIVLERGRIAERWRSQRWDSFTLVTPTGISCNLPGFPYQGDDPDGFMPRDELVAFFERYADSFHPPVRCGVEVTRVTMQAEGYLVETADVLYATPNVIVATGLL